MCYKNKLILILVYRYNYKKIFDCVIAFGILATSKQSLLLIFHNSNLALGFLNKTIYIKFGKFYT